jgi:hypothetical protein
MSVMGASLQLVALIGGMTAIGAVLIFIVLWVITWLGHVLPWPPD